MDHSDALYAAVGILPRAKGQRSNKTLLPTNDLYQIGLFVTDVVWPVGWKLAVLGKAVTKHGPFEVLTVTSPEGLIVPAFRRDHEGQDFCICQDFSYVAR